MKTVIRILILLLSATTAYGQVWSNVGGGMGDKIYDLMKFDNKLYAGGRIGVKYWNGNNWTSLPNPFGIAFPLTLATYKDTLYAGGDFPYAGSISHVLKYNGSTWVHAGGPFDDPLWSSTKKLLTFQGQLIAGGKFNSINFNSFNNIAAWNGTSWNNLGNGLNGIVLDLVEHQGALYASGNFTASGTDNTVRFVAKWNGSSWLPLTNSHIFKSSGPMISYNNSLLIGSVTDTISGIPMKGIARWNGTNFVSMGNNSIKSVSNFWVFNNDLFLCGKTYNQNPNDDDDVVLKWDGNTWQQMGGIFNQPILVLEDFNNQIFAAGFFTTPNSYISRLSLLSNIPKEKEATYLKIYPNPATDKFIFNAKEKGYLQIHNSLGQIISEHAINKGNTEIDVYTLSNGVYFLNYQANNQLIKSKLIIQK